ncbi:MAG: hypothetical protein QGH69_05085 [Alphaproteobacteria bacterium]|jgi:hypothetical protein|nr:hypothetical protein [Alphaproteobacteria bacterium]
MQKILSLIPSLIDALKWVGGLLYIRRSTQIESERDALAQTNDIQKQQLEIAADPLADPRDVRDSMQNDEF